MTELGKGWEVVNQLEFLRFGNEIRGQACALYMTVGVVDGCSLYRLIHIRFSANPDKPDAAGFGMQGIHMTAKDGSRVSDWLHFDPRDELNRLVTFTSTSTASGDTTLKVNTIKDTTGYSRGCRQICKSIYFDTSK